MVALVWTEVGQSPTLEAAAVLKGRPIRLLWAGYDDWGLCKNQNNLEKGLLRLLKTMPPDHVKVIVLADGGFGRTELTRTRQQLGFHYRIRVSPDVWVEAEDFRGRLPCSPVENGVVGW